MPINDFAIVRDSELTEMAGSSERPIKDYILRVMREDKLRPVDVLNNAKRLKLELRQATFQEIYSGNTSNPQVYTLINISKALGRPFEEMVAAIQGSNSVNAAAFKQSEFALLWQLYDKLGGKEQRKVADRFIDMIKRELTELLKQQGETNLIHLRK